jgi:hypothetical protein
MRRHSLELLLLVVSCSWFVQPFAIAVFTGITPQSATKKSMSTDDLLNINNNEDVDVQEGTENLSPWLDRVSRWNGVR